LVPAEGHQARVGKRETRLPLPGGERKEVKGAILTRAVILILFLMTLAGCATVEHVPPRISPKVTGIYHEVLRGETLWKISKAYGIDTEEVARLNRLPDASRINAGQLIFIPYAKERLSTSKVQARDESFIWPVKGTIVSHFGSLKGGVRNKGIDIAVAGGTSVFASRGGKVSFRDDKVKGYGKTVIIDHGDDYSTVYTYNSAILSEVGDYVERGSIIARAGSTGRAEQPSLHFEIRKRHKPENPFYYLP